MREFYRRNLNIPVRADERESPRGLLKPLTIWYIKHNLWGYGKVRKILSDQAPHINKKRGGINVEKLLDEIESYWSTRTEGYSEVNHKRACRNAEKRMA